MGENKFQKVIDVAARCGFAAPEKLQAEIAGLENPQYRVAVVGQFQVGKSTLINRVFLKDHPILLEGIGLPKTAVCTEAEYGEARRLEVYDFEGKLVSAVDDPGKSDVEQFTVGKDRKALAKAVSRVRITEPNESLKSYTVIDTPGIDDPEPELLIDTTYRVIPSADLAILMVEPKMLDTSDLDLLQKQLGRGGVARLMVLVSFNPKKDMQDAAQRKDIVEAIQAKLQNIGLADVPVRFFCYDAADEYNDTLNTPEKIEAEVVAFLKANALAGREARIAAHVKDYLETCLANIAAQLAAAEKSEAEKAELLAGLADRRAELAKQCDRLELDLDNDFDRLARILTREVAKETGDLIKKYEDGIANAESIDALKAIVEKMGENLSRDVAEMFDKKGLEIQNEIRLALAKRMPQKSDFGTEWTAFWDEKMPEIDPGFLAKIPNWVYEILNIFTLDMLLPLGPLTAIIGRLIQRQIPILREITLNNLALTYMKKQVTDAIKENSSDMKERLEAKFSAEFANIANSVKKEIRNHFSAQLDAVEAGVKNGKAADKTALLNAKTEIEAAIAAL